MDYTSSIIGWMNLFIDFCASLESSIYKQIQLIVTCLFYKGSEDRIIVVQQLRCRKICVIIMIIIIILPFSLTSMYVYVNLTVMQTVSFLPRAETLYIPLRKSLARCGLVPIETSTVCPNTIPAKSGKVVDYKLRYLDDVKFRVLF